VAASKVHLLCRAAACGTPTYTLVRLRSSALHFAGYPPWAGVKPFTCHLALPKKPVSAARTGEACAAWMVKADVASLSHLEFL